jgi:LmbE family N-acetylglucosaminyl deacetylase
VFICLFVFVAQSSFAADASNESEILQDLKRFGEMGSVLYVAAHPDDENTQLITYLARGRHYRTAYLSVTRGDGGQNAHGPEFGEQLGVIRTQELLAARKIDGGRQFFTRAIDFGFSKDYRETLKIWDKQQVLGDVVRIIRTFRPDVIVTRFSPEPGNTHGHHTASAVLALEAFKLAGDPKAYPEQLTDLKPWQPKRILMNGRGGGGLSIDISGNDPVTGEPFGRMAGRSRSMHKTQGFGNFGGGGGGGGGARPESFTLLDGEPATKDILDGVDTTWARIEGGADVEKLIDDVIAKFDQNNPSGSVPALLALRHRVESLASDPIVNEKRSLLDRILQSCLGLSVETTIANAQIVPGEAMKLHHTVTVGSDTPVKWLGVRYPTIEAKAGDSIDLKRGQAQSFDSTQTLPANTPLTQPYWLREQGATGTYRVDDAKLIGMAENPPAFPVEFVFEVGGQTLTVPDEPVQNAPDTKYGERPRRIDVIAPVSLSFPWQVQLIAPGKAHAVSVEISGARADTSGTLHLEAPQGWKIEPASQAFQLSAIGDRTKLAFTITAPPQAASAEIRAVAEVNGAKFDNQRIEINYPHVPLIVLQPHARLKAVAMDLQTRGHTIGYVSGAGDDTAQALEQMGYEVKTLAGADLTPEKLKDLDAVVIGVRAFNVRTDLAGNMPNLFAYVEAGGNVIEQYNRPEGLKTNKFAPFNLRLSGERVTDEDAAIKFLAPEHPSLNTPNKITPADFDGWVQERGIYFPHQWDEHWTAILACNDPNEAPKNGSLLIAQHGKGYFVYTGLVFFRELPAGVPGSFRLFANLVSLGK